VALVGPAGGRALAKPDSDTYMLHVRRRRGGKTPSLRCLSRFFHTGLGVRNFKRLKRLTVLRAEDYIGALGRTAALARWRVRETLTVYAVNHPAMTHGHVGCAGVGGSGSCWGYWFLRGSGIFDGSVRVRAV
jgi:hypothetical protein